jgi:hypothetical protein
MFGKRTVIIIIDGVSVDSSVGMSVSDDMTVMLAVGVIESEANVIMTRVSGRCFRCGNKHSLEKASVAAIIMMIATRRRNGCLAKCNARAPRCLP